MDVLGNSKYRRPDAATRPQKDYENSRIPTHTSVEMHALLDADETVLLTGEQCAYSVTEDYYCKSNKSIYKCLSASWANKRDSSRHSWEERLNVGPEVLVGITQ